MEMLIPIARWRGLGGDTDPFRRSFETMTWAAGIAAATERINVVSTLHLPMTHPVLAAKQCVTIDHIAHGRYAFNAVMGWFAPDMVMFGARMRDHDERYHYGAEWMEIVRRLWTEEEPFDFSGEYFELRELQAHPKPFQDPPPVLIVHVNGLVCRRHLHEADLLSTQRAEPNLHVPHAAGLSKGISEYLSKRELEAVAVWLHSLKGLKVGFESDNFFAIIDANHESPTPLGVEKARGRFTATRRPPSTSELATYPLAAPGDRTDARSALRTALPAPFPELRPRTPGPPPITVSYNASRTIPGQLQPLLSPWELSFHPCSWPEASARNLLSTSMRQEPRRLAPLTLDSR